MTKSKSDLEKYHLRNGYRLFAAGIILLIVALVLGYVGIFEYERSDAGRPISVIVGLILFGFSIFLFVLQNRQHKLANEVAMEIAREAEAVKRVFEEATSEWWHLTPQQRAELEMTGRVRTPSVRPQEGELLH